MTDYFHQTQRVGACVRCAAPFVGPPTQERCAECAKARKREMMKRYRARQKAKATRR
jgi:hypothetical protein